VCFEEFWCRGPCLFLTVMGHNQMNWRRLLGLFLSISLVMGCYAVVRKQVLTSDLALAFAARDYVQARRLVVAGADINAPFGGGDRRGSILTGLVHAGDQAGVEAAMELGADPNRQCGLGDTPLLRAVSFGNAEMVELLLARGADTRVEGRDGRSPLDVARAEGNHCLLRLLTSGELR
jgi:hypothetical protein